eukprot:4624954-Alexandrium_andersonii.AAC.1
MSTELWTPTQFGSPAMLAQGVLAWISRVMTTGYCPADWQQSARIAGTTMTMLLSLTRVPGI